MPTDAIVAGGRLPAMAVRAPGKDLGVEAMTVQSATERAPQSTGGLVVLLYPSQEAVDDDGIRRIRFSMRPSDGVNLVRRESAVV